MTPFLRLPHWLDDEPLSAQEHRVLYHVLRRASGKGDCWESLEKMKTHCRISRATLCRALKKLVWLQLLEKEERCGESSLYRPGPRLRDLVQMENTPGPNREHPLVQRKNTPPGANGEHKGEPIPRRTPKKKWVGSSKWWNQKGPISLSELEEWIDDQNRNETWTGSAKTLAKDFVAEMKQEDWKVQGQAVVSGLAVFRKRLEKKGMWTSKKLNGAR